MDIEKWKEGIKSSEGRDTLEEAHVFGDEVLIGQTVFEKLDLFVDCQG